MKTHRSQNRSRGFTLIELLIVVAIIAILAAIAVPNFLEAQTRSKVSRVKADQRTVATALESYVIDHNKYPPAQHPSPPTHEWTDTWNNGYFPGQLAPYSMLTTPISYITAAPQDPFDPTRRYSNYYGFYRYCDRWSWEKNYAGYGPNYSAFDQNFSWPGKEKTQQWVVISYGPDKLEGLQKPPISPTDEVAYVGGLSGTAAVRIVHNVYDPSNGTRSRGDIFRWGP